MSEVDRLHDRDLAGDYPRFLAEVVDEIKAARILAGRAVNAERTRMYWRIGQLILTRQKEQGWGSAVIDRLARDVATHFPGMRGWSPRNLQYMRSLAAAYPDDLAAAAAQLPWGHVLALLDRVPDQQERDWYAGQAVAFGWSRAVLMHHVDSRRYERVGRVPDNFEAALPAADQDLVREVLADPYDLEFLALDPVHTERQLEDALISKLSAFLVELGTGFAFVGRQYRLSVGDEEFFVDLLFFHLGLRRYVVFELKVDKVRPEHLGKLGFYVTVVDDQLRKAEYGDGPTIGILLARYRNDVVVEYALRTVDAPVAVATYTTDRTLPEDLRRALPSADELAELMGDLEEPGMP